MVGLSISSVSSQVTPIQITDNSVFDVNPHIASDASGNSYIVWKGNDGDNEIFWAKVTPSGTVTQKQISENTVNDQYPQIAVDASGNSYITWEGNDGDNEIFWAKVTPSGAVSKTQVSINTEDYDKYPQIAVDASGNSYITWTHKAGVGVYDIVWAKVDSSGTVTNKKSIDTLTSVNNASSYIAADAFGNSYIAWQGYTGGHHNVFWAKVDPSGTVTPIQITDNSIHEYPRQIALDASGNSYIVWRANDNEIYLARVGPSGTFTTIQITDNSEVDTDPQIAVDASGSSYITWRGYDSSAAEIFWAKVNPSGTFTTMQITDNSEGDVHPFIAADASGNSYITWFLLTNSGSEYDIFWAKVESSGVFTTMQITNTLRNDNPQIAADASGTSYIVWKGYDGDSEIFFVKMMVATNNLISPASFKPMAATKLAKVNSLWNCISANLPEEISLDMNIMIEEAQAHISNATSITNPIYSCGELEKAIDILESVSETFNLGCIYQ